MSAQHSELVRALTELRPWFWPRLPPQALPGRVRRYDRSHKTLSWIVRQRTGLSRATVNRGLKTLIDVLSRTIHSGKPVRLELGPIGTVWRRSDGVILSRPGKEIAVASAWYSGLRRIRNDGLQALRPDDAALIETYVSAAQGGGPRLASLAAEIYNPRSLRQRKVNAESVRSALRLFARFIPLPLTQVGLDGQPPGGPYALDHLRAEVFRFAAWYEQRTDRIDQYRSTAGASNYRAVPSVHPFERPNWLCIVDGGLGFFDWCEQVRIRPPGSNPFAGIVRPRIRQLPARPRLPVQRSLCEQVMDNPQLTLKERAVVMLAANGLRAREIALLRQTDIDFPRGLISLIGKGGKARNIPLYDRTRLALTAWMRRRPKRAVLQSTNIWGHNIQSDPSKFVLDLVTTAVRKTYPDREDIRVQLTPHRFRHFFISEARLNGMNTEILRAIVGHSTLDMLDLYTSVDADTLLEAIRTTEQQITRTKKKEQA